MRKLLILLLFAFSSVAFAAEQSYFEKGVEAYNSGSHKSAMAFWEKGKESGDSQAILALGTHIYSSGAGIGAPDKVKALELYREAATLGNAEAMSEIAHCYLFGIGVNKNETLGLEWEIKAAQAGYASAAMSVGDIYAEGVIVKKDLKKAFEWHLKGAMGGHELSQLYVGEALLKGRGVAKNPESAKEWLAKAAAQGNDDATELLAKF